MRVQRVVLVDAGGAAAPAPAVVADVVAPVAVVAVASQQISVELLVVVVAAGKHVGNLEESLRGRIY